MKSGKQRRMEIMAKRAKRWKGIRQSAAISKRNLTVPGAIRVNPWLLAPSNSYAWPPEYYVDRAFSCRDCGAQCVWTAERQQWWCEVAKGSILSSAIRCRPCRAKERARISEARRTSAAGLLRKQAMQTK